MYSEVEESYEEIKQKMHRDIAPLPFYTRHKENKETETRLVRNEDIDIKCNYILYLLLLILINTLILTKLRYRVFSF